MTKHFHAPNPSLTLAQRQRGFFVHATVFVPVVLGEVIINALTGGPAWSLWVLASWSIGLFAHWFFAVGPGAWYHRQG